MNNADGDISHLPDDSVTPPVHSRNPLTWLTIFGPGAVIASLTIGTGELIFSTRGGALFGYRILFLFVLISLLKWGLVIATARHMVLTGVHPYQRMMELRGPRGWFPLMLFLVAAMSMPVWLSFHSSILGNLTSWITDTRGQLGGGTDCLWGGVIFAGVLVLTATGGYSALERIQIIIVVSMVFCAGVTLILYNPDWWELLRGAIIPQPLAYPSWIGDFPEYRQIAEQPVWVETTRYVGVIGGAGFDYLAYTSWLREKRWGRAGLQPATDGQLQEMAADPKHPVRRWTRAPLIDCSISFALIVAFSAVFVASGAMILGPNFKIPNEDNLLNLQSEFVTRIHAWLLPLYVTGAFLTMIGTLYGALEITESIVSEMLYTLNPKLALRHRRRARLLTVLWCAVFAYGILGWMFWSRVSGGPDKPRMLLQIMTPINLFSGVFFCGIICLLVLWMDRRFLPQALRMPWWLMVLNLVSAVIFIFLGLKGYWEAETLSLAIAVILSTVVLAWILAWFAEKWRPTDDLPNSGA